MNGCGVIEVCDWRPAGDRLAAPVSLPCGEYGKYGDLMWTWDNLRSATSASYGLSWPYGLVSMGAEGPEGNQGGPPVPSGRVGLPG